MIMGIKTKKEMHVKMSLINVSWTKISTRKIAKRCQLKSTQKDSFNLKT